MNVPQNQQSNYILRSITLHKTYAYTHTHTHTHTHTQCKNEMVPHMAVQQRQHVDAVGRRMFLAG